MRLLLKKILSYLPTKLPVGLTEFNTWADSIIELSGQFADRDSMVFAISSILIHADSKYGALPKKYFVDRLRKSAANQVASQAFQDIKQRQDTAIKAEQQKQAEATAIQQVADAPKEEKTNI
jgi:hypothetical protein